MIVGRGGALIRMKDDLYTDVRLRRRRLVLVSPNQKKGEGRDIGRRRHRPVLVSPNQEKGEGKDIGRPLTMVEALAHRLITVELVVRSRIMVEIVDYPLIVVVIAVHPHPRDVMILMNVVEEDSVILLLYPLPDMPDVVLSLMTVVAKKIESSLSSYETLIF